MNDLAAWRAAAERVAAAAGGHALALFGRLAPGQVAFKGARDLVTRADVECERIARDGLRLAFPGHAVVGEEEVSAAAGGAGDRPRDLSAIAAAVAGDGFTWLVDPIDGTTNFAHGHPFFAVSLALWRRGAPVLGVVFAPALGEMFSAVAGGGALKNGYPLRVSDTAVLGDAIFATGFPYRRELLSPLENNVEHFNRFILDVRGFRRCGSAAIDLCFVAAARYDFFFEAQLEPWDVAAGGLIVREAGGRVTDWRGGDDWLCGRRMLASNGAIHATALERMAPEWTRRPRT